MIILIFATFVYTSLVFFRHCKKLFRGFQLYIVKTGKTATKVQKLNTRLSSNTDSAVRYAQAQGTKYSFLRAIREVAPLVAPEMELFLEKHGQYIKKIVIKLIFVQLRLEDYV